METIKNSLVAVCLLGVIVLTGCYSYLVVQQIKSQNPVQNVGGGYAPVEPYFLTAGSGIASSVGSIGISATTTNRVFLTNGGVASSTITLPLENADELDVNLRAIASSSASILQMAEYVSDNGLDYYPVDIATSTPQTYLSTIVSSGENPRTWSLSTSTSQSCFTNEVCKHIIIPVPGYAKFVQLRFTVTGSNASVWGYAVPRRYVPN